MNRRTRPSLFVGSTREALEIAGPDAAVEAFPDSVIVPGLIDNAIDLLGETTSDAVAARRLKIAVGLG